MSEPEAGFPSSSKKVREHLDLSQEDLARALLVSFSTLNRWENRKTKPIKLARNQLLDREILSQ